MNRLLTCSKPKALILVDENRRASWALEARTLVAVTGCVAHLCETSTITNVGVGQYPSLLYPNPKTAQPRHCTNVASRRFVARPIPRLVDLALVAMSTFIGDHWRRTRCCSLLVLLMRFLMTDFWATLHRVTISATCSLQHRETTAIVRK